MCGTHTPHTPPWSTPPGGHEALHLLLPHPPALVDSTHGAGGPTKMSAQFRDWVVQAGQGGGRAGRLEERGCSRTALAPFHHKPSRPSTSITLNMEKSKGFVQNIKAFPCLGCQLLLLMF